jgi:hypothetical protein
MIIFDLKVEGYQEKFGLIPEGQVNEKLHLR